MKKVILLAVVLTLSTGAFAQRYWDFGVKAGANISGITKDDAAGTKAGLYVGAFAEYRLNEFFGIQPELVYSRQGASIDSDTVEKIRLNYLNLPILAKIYVLDALSVDLGPQFGLLLNAKTVMADANDIDIESADDLDVSFAMGLSYRVTPRIDISARYNLGLTKIDGPADSKNSVIQFGAGYRF